MINKQIQKHNITTSKRVLRRFSFLDTQQQKARQYIDIPKIGYFNADS